MGKNLLLRMYTMRSLFHNHHCLKYHQVQKCIHYLESNERIFV